MSRIEAARNIIRQCGLKNVAAWTKRSTKQIYCWTYQRADGGTAGIPEDHVPTIIAKAAEHLKLTFTPNDFFNAPPTVGPLAKRRKSHDHRASS